MTQYPEAILAREQEMCYVNISLITDYDVGLESNEEIEPVTLEEVVKIFNENNEKVRKLIFNLIPKLPTNRECICSKALEGARF